jgi:hypothetical protein
MCRSGGRTSAKAGHASAWRTQRFRCLTLS